MGTKKRLVTRGSSNRNVNKNLLFKYSLKSKLCQIEDILDSFYYLLEVGYER